MGASREVTFARAAEPALLLALAAVARTRRQPVARRRCCAGDRRDGLAQRRPGVRARRPAALLVVLLAENARIPVDDPTTHLELTMIHEVMVLDHGGPDLAFILYGAALKLWVLGALLVGPARARPHRRVAGSTPPRSLGGMLAPGRRHRASSSRRWRACGCVRVPQLLVGAGVLRRARAGAGAAVTPADAWLDTLLVLHRAHEPACCSARAASARASASSRSRACCSALLPLVAHARRARPARSLLLAGASIGAQGRRVPVAALRARCATPTCGARSSPSSATVSSLLAGMRRARRCRSGSARGCRCPTPPISPLRRPGRAVHDARRPVPHRQPPQGADAGARLPGARERHLRLRRRPRARGRRCWSRLGILLDVFVAVFVMGIAIFHISREFDHIDTRPARRRCKDWTAMILALVLLPAALAGVAAFVPARAGSRRGACSSVAAIAHAASTRRGLGRGRPAPAWQRLARARRAGPAVPQRSRARCSSPPRSTPSATCARESTRTPRRTSRRASCSPTRPRPSFTGCLLLLPRDDDAGRRVSQHFGLLWVAIEATTLASAPLIYFHRHHRSLEATWKYLLICSVGIALALLGNFFLAVAAAVPGGTRRAAACCADLVARARQRSSRAWLKAAFLLLLVGYGTKMGLAPLHTWLPDAHSEAPSVVSALLSGALLELRLPRDPARAAGVRRRRPGGLRARQLLIGLRAALDGASPPCSSSGRPTTSACSPIRASSTWASCRSASASAAPATFGALLHAVNHSLTKAMLFLVAGNILAAVPHEVDRATCAGCSRVLPVVGRALDRRVPRDHRLAAVRAVPQRVHDPARRARQGGRGGVALSTWRCSA